MLLLNSIILVFFTCFFSFSQECNIYLKLYVKDYVSKKPLSDVYVFIEEYSKYFSTDSLGFVELNNICPGNYHFRFSHFFCNTKTEHIQIESDSSMVLYMEHNYELIDQVVLEGYRNDKDIQINNNVNQDILIKRANKSLSDIISVMPGVNSLKTGSGISKPIIHGLYGSRIGIINNGIELSNQKWGNDHSPEIDPFIANNISVIKGVSTLEYISNSLGGLVLLETKGIGKQYHFHGQLNYVFESNGNGNTINFNIYRYSDILPFKLGGTFKIKGDLKTPDYYLTNTSKREGSMFVKFEKNIFSNIDMDFYYSFFYNKLGILRGSHISNLTDLDRAINRSVPFFTKDDFSYNIDNPYQNTQHHLFKLEATYKPIKNKIFKLKYGFQINNRKEFDVRRASSIDKPSLGLDKKSHTLDFKYIYNFIDNATFRTGLQFNYLDNTNDANTGVLPLIPDYNLHNLGSFLIFKNVNDNLIYELGFRYDFKRMHVLSISRSLPKVINKKNHFFNNYSFSTAIGYNIGKLFKFNFNIGHIIRNPDINELYSFGVHQGVSAIEEGRNYLKTERSLKFILSTDFNLVDNLYFQVIPYYQLIYNFIYLKPQKEKRLTIRGAFPVFVYWQTDAYIYGTDLVFSYQPIDDIKISINYDLVGVYNKSDNQPIVNMPSDNLQTSISYYFNTSYFRENSISLDFKYVFEPDKKLQEQDIMKLPQESYFLVNLNFDTNIHMDKHMFKFFFRVENMLNIKYRDYLNRQKYFADDIGINFSFGTNWQF